MLMIIIEILLISLLLFNIARIIKRYRALSSMPYLDPLDRFAQSLPKAFGKGKFLSIIMFEVKIIYYSLITLFSIPTNISTSTSFSYDKTSQFKTISIVLGIIVIAESILLQIIIDAFIINRYSNQWLQAIPWLVHLLNIYVILFIIGQYRAMRAVPHHITQESLVVNNGILGSASIPFIFITAINKAKEIGIGEKVDPMTFYAHNSVDSPHYELILSKPILYEGAYGKKRYVNKVVLRVDDQASFITRLNDVLSINVNKVN